MSKLSTKETVEAYHLIEKHTKKSEGGLVEYEDGFNDARIAAMVGKDAPASAIGRIRTENFGKLAAKAGNDPRVQMLEGRLSDMTNRFNKLCDAVSLNRGTVDVRHLKITPMGDSK